jgi:DNA-binding IclR family transcriptional regulator
MTASPKQTRGERIYRSYPSPNTAMVIVTLEALTNPENRGASMRALARKLDISAATLHRIGQTLEQLDIVVRDPDGGYELGTRGLGLAARARARDVHVVAEPVLRGLHARLGETVNLAIPHGPEMLVVAAVESALPLRASSWAGQHDAMHASALGKSYLAALPETAFRRYIDTLQLRPRTSRSITDRKRLLREIDATRKRGFAVDDGESAEGMRCVGAAICADGRHVVGAVSVSAPVGRMTEESLDDVGALVCRAAEAIGALVEGTWRIDTEAG